MISWETSEPVYRLALEWSQAADGTPICYDDGQSYDYIESTLTGRLLPDEMEALNTAWTTNREYVITSTGFLLGPEVDMSAGVMVTLVDVVSDGPVDSSMTMYDVTIKIHYANLPTLTDGDLRLALSSGVPYHQAIPSTTFNVTARGRAVYTESTVAVDRSCKWYAAHLSQQDAASAVAALRLLRGGQFAWYPNGALEPWGPGIEPNALIWIPDWQVVADSPMTWGIEATLVRDQAPPESSYMVGDTGDRMVGDSGEKMIGRT